MIKPVGISALIVLSGLGVASCQYDPNSNTYVTAKPNESDVVGTYQFSRQFVDASAVVPGHPIIILSADHTCELPDFPDWIAGAGASTWKLNGTHSGKGAWTLEVVGGLGDGSGTSKDIYGIRLVDSAGTVFPKLTLSNGQRGLCFGYGDPDGGNAMTFEKIK